VLKDLLNNGIIANDLAAVAGNSVRVTSKPPDLLKTGADEEAGLNLFLYHTWPQHDDSQQQPAGIRCHAATA
jgi:hypothetical protein